MLQQEDIQILPLCTHENQLCPDPAALRGAQTWIPRSSHWVISTEYRPFTMDVGSAWFSLSLFEKVYHKDKFLSVVRTWETEKLYCFSILFCFVSDSFWLKILCLKVPSVRWSWWSLRGGIVQPRRSMILYCAASDSLSVTTGWPGFARLQRRSWNGGH